VKKPTPAQYGVGDKVLYNKKRYTIRSADEKGLFFALHRRGELLSNVWEGDLSPVISKKPPVFGVGDIVSAPNGNQFRIIGIDGKVAFLENHVGVQTRLNFKLLTLVRKVNLLNDSVDPPQKITPRIEPIEYLREDGVAMFRRQADKLWYLRKIDGPAFVYDRFTHEWFPFHALEVERYNTLGLPFDDAYRLLEMVTK
jgi:hypothetical protein